MRRVLGALVLALGLSGVLALPSGAAPATDTAAANLAHGADVLRLGAMGVGPLIKALPADGLAAAGPLVRVGMRGDGDLADPAARRALSAIPDAIRATLRPVMAVREPGGIAVFSASPVAPGFIILTHIAKDPDSDTGVETLSLFDMEHP